MKLLILLCLIATSCLSEVPPSPAVRQAVETCSLSPVGSDNRVVRWGTPPSVSVWSDDASAEPIVQAAVGILADALKPAKFGITLMAPRTAQAHIRFVFCRRDVFPQTLKQHNAIPVGGRNWGWYRWWDANRQLERMVIVMSYEQGDAAKASSSVLQALFLALGPSNWMPLPKPADPTAPTLHEAGDLSALDKQFLAFFYAHLHINDKAFEVRRAFDKSWK